MQKGKCGTRNNHHPFSVLGIRDFISAPLTESGILGIGLFPIDSPHTRIDPVTGVTGRGRNWFGPGET